MASTRNDPDSRKSHGSGADAFGSFRCDKYRSTSKADTPLTVWPSGLRRWLQAPARKGVGSNPTAVIFAFRFQFDKLQNNCRLAVICYLFGSCPQQSCSELCDARRFGQFLTLDAFQHCCNSAIRKTRKPGKSTNRSALQCERIQTHSPMYSNSCAGIDKLPCWFSSCDK
jgi:hypothetical protein